MITKLPRSGAVGDVMRCVTSALLPVYLPAGAAVGDVMRCETSALLPVCLPVGAVVGDVMRCETSALLPVCLPVGAVAAACVSGPAAEGPGVMGEVRREPGTDDQNQKALIRQSTITYAKHRVTDSCCKAFHAR